MNGKLLKTTVYSVLISIIYVITLYFKQPKGNRNDTPVIKSRLIRVSIASTFIIVTLPYVMIYVLGTLESIDQFFTISSLNKINTDKLINTLQLFVGLFLGPVIERVFDYPNFSDMFTDIKENFTYEWIFILRDLIIAPFTEELVYTTATLTLFVPFMRLTTDTQNELSITQDSVILTSSGTFKVLFLTPLLFGIAHLHHAIDMYRQGTKTLMILITVAFQLTYTTLFGILTNYIWLYTNSFWCCFLAHSFCNFMGFPSLTVDGSIFIKVGYWVLLVLSLCWFKYKFWELLAIEGGLNYIVDLQSLYPN